LISGLFWFRNFDLAGIDAGERTYPENAQWLESHLPANAVVASMQTSGAIFYYTSFALFRWDIVSAAEFERIAAACAAAGRPVYASLYPFEIEDQGAFRKHLTGHWSQIGKVRDSSIWRYDAKGSVP
jgi:hypothetical protein